MTDLNEAGENCGKRLLFLHIRGDMQGQELIPEER